MKRLRSIFMVGLLLLAGAIFGRMGDNPSTARTPPPASVTTPTPAAPAVPLRETRYVTADRLNVRASPAASGSRIGSLERGTRIDVRERRGGWLLVSADGLVGYVNEQYTATAPPQALVTRRPVARAAGPSCSPRRTCSQIASCEDAYHYLRNCNWGSRLDGDNDGVPCESICR